MSNPHIHQKLPTNWNEREILRDKGQFWTPSWVAEAMVTYAAQETDLLFDPATGRGAFFEALSNLQIPQVAFRGADVDAEVLSDEIYKKNPCIIENRDFIKNPPQEKFHAIVANPPYIRHHRSDAQTKQRLRQLALDITGTHIDGRAGYHVYFFIQALNLLEENGRIAFIMPADVCEGKFADNLWNWISTRFRIEGVITFTENATPFPGVDTNAIVFLIRKAKPQKILQWVRVKEAYSPELKNFVRAGFIPEARPTLEITERTLEEGIKTGLSRPPQTNATSKFHLSDFARVMRGIATGANEFFFLTSRQVEELRIPPEYLKNAVGRTRDVQGDRITEEDLRQLDQKGRPVHLFSVNGQSEFPTSVMNYLQHGTMIGLPERALIQQRQPWYKMETRKIPPLLFAYLGRRNSRFIKNSAGVLPLTGFLCVYPLVEDMDSVNRLWRALNHPATIENLKLVGKSYGSGAIKVEPGNLGKLPIPEAVVDEFSLSDFILPKHNQMELFSISDNSAATSKIFHPQQPSTTTVRNNT
ncbi:MAG: SAM-dependent methyltransferase [Puniceicoccales bacterium]|jgi:hypothetical protein|nr:SAM-dependent methyltransferase [Puniceicoccales bacterium]